MDPGSLHWGRECRRNRSRMGEGVGEVTFGNIQFQVSVGHFGKHGAEKRSLNWSQRLGSDQYICGRNTSCVERTQKRWE